MDGIYFELGFQFGPRFRFELGSCFWFAFRIGLGLRIGIAFLSAPFDQRGVLMKAIRRVQDLESQRLRRAATLEETLAAMSQAYLQRKDPIEKAKRAQAKGCLKPQPVPGQSSRPSRSTTAPSKREPVPAATSHHVTLRDQDQCTDLDPQGRRCPNRRWLEVHHVIEVSRGGTHHPDNLTTFAPPTTVCDTEPPVSGRRRVSTSDVSMLRLP